MAKCFCPMSDVAIQHIRALSESYRLLIAAANDYNGIALANRRQIEKAIDRADRLGEIIEGYICSWENCSPCLVYSCGWEFCRRNLEILNSIPNLPDPPVCPTNTTATATSCSGTETTNANTTNADAAEATATTQDAPTPPTPNVTLRLAATNAMNTVAASAINAVANYQENPKEALPFQTRGQVPPIPTLPKIPLPSNDDDTK